MIKIDYTLEYLCGEPGPNIYFMGKPIEYAKLSNDLHELGERPDITFTLNDLKYINILNDYNIICKSSKDGNILNKVSDKQITIDLTTTMWRTLLIQIYAISFYPCHDYLEFDGVNLIEDANIMVSSEF
jgi:hypothetical protein